MTNHPRRGKRAFYKARVTWNYRRGDEDGITLSINEKDFGTWAQARDWIETKIPKRDPQNEEVGWVSPRDPELELDVVYLDELGDFADAEGEPCESRRIAMYEHGPREWTWAKEA
jgi:hypothetical protein